MFESLRPALYSDYLNDKTIEKEEERFKHWQTLLKKSDKLWLYANNEVLTTFKKLFNEYEHNNKEEFNIEVEKFINEWRKDVLFSLGRKNNYEQYRFITYNMNKDILPNNLI